MYAKPKSWPPSGGIKNSREPNDCCRGNTARFFSNLDDGAGNLDGEKMDGEKTGNERSPLMVPPHGGSTIPNASRYGDVNDKLIVDPAGDTTPSFCWLPTPLAGAVLSLFGASHVINPM